MYPNNPHKKLILLNIHPCCQPPPTGRILINSGIPSRQRSPALIASSSAYDWNHWSLLFGGDLMMHNILHSMQSDASNVGMLNCKSTKRELIQIIHGKYQDHIQ